MGLVTILKDGADRLQEDIYPLGAAVFDRRTPLMAKLLAALVVGYAVSPIDLIPDFIPFAGWIDDVIVVGFGIKLARKLIPPEVWADAQAASAPVERKITRTLKLFQWTAMGLVVLLALALLFVLLAVIWLVTVVARAV